MVIRSRSARMTTPNQTLESAPTVTSPTRTAPGASHGVSASDSSGRVGVTVPLRPTGDRAWLGAGAVALLLAPDPRPPLGMPAGGSSLRLVLDEGHVTELGTEMVERGIGRVAVCGDLGALVGIEAIEPR